jgi:hypothetical protein
MKKEAVPDRPGEVALDRWSRGRDGTCVSEWGIRIRDVNSRRFGKMDWMPDRVWRQVRRHISIPCLDIILENRRREVLLGWRRIPPYKNV